MNYLNAVFWDYPELTDIKKLKKFIEDSKNKDSYFWILTRFLEHGRVVDTLHFFSLKEISENIQKLKLSNYSAKKWKRLIEVYGAPGRK